jgi:superfamily I DNA/RNA helicase
VVNGGYRARHAIAITTSGERRSSNTPSASSDEAGPPLRDEGYLILSTIHSAKGQEWRSVFILNAVDGCIPSDLGTGTRYRPTHWCICRRAWQAQRR